VLVASTGATLLDGDALDAFCELLLPLAGVLTPNLPEARTLVGHAGRARAGMVAPAPRAGAPAARPDEAADEGAGERGAPELDDLGLAKALHRLGPRHVVLTGGHRTVASDLYWDGEMAVEIPGQRHLGGATHGSGCTHSAVLAAELGLGRSVLDAARVARRISGEAVARGLAGLGGGEGPVDVLGLAGAPISGRRDRLP
jgi:hydroxymethylpyrimidine/phosphomethylpyrimidine kinase